ncbi:hypothetical protein GCM10009557_49860 [Virgisporangium ochraceum]|uniref:Uncharacterized protein n=1 Tax=Virgisporangium ochraceum TaxID=65505 RepID=A0A8J4A617_9ACTN|nr:hypothetical protein Voc01_101040 [Virgisporangium ochraceum]
MLVTPRFARLQCALVLELAEVHELAHWGACHWRNLDQIQVDIGGQLQGALERDDAHLLTLRADQPYFACSDLLVDAWLDADGASSIGPLLVPDHSEGAPEAGKQRGPGACLRMLGPARPVNRHTDDAPPLRRGVRRWTGTDRTRPPELVTATVTRVGAELRFTYRQETGGVVDS